MDEIEKAEAGFKGGFRREGGVQRGGGGYVYTCLLASLEKARGGVVCAGFLGLL
jgi:hypothetical protein